MRIISQNNHDVNYDDIEIFPNDNSVCCFYNRKVGMETLGVYSTKERALKVMKEIRKTYVEQKWYGLIQDSQFFNKYFQMPKE
ncbi:MAG: hypothetical protein ACTSPI_14230 [Candidatus Heimdallarchaeaceae archaeon]